MALEFSPVRVLCVRKTSDGLNAPRAYTWCVWSGPTARAGRRARARWVVLRAVNY